jgi:hypothetical protein
MICHRVLYLASARFLWGYHVIFVLFFGGILIWGSSQTAFGQAPSITNQLRSQVILMGQTAVFEAQTVGGEPMGYQWQFNGTNILGATSAMLSFPATGDHVGMYQVTVSNAAGVIQSPEASFSVFTITQTPTNSAFLTLFWVPLQSYRVEALTNLATVQEWQTAWGAKQLLNVNTATLSQLTTVVMDPNLAAEIIHRRAGPDGIDGTEDDMPFRSPAEVGALSGGVVPNSLTVTDAPIRIYELREPGQPQPIYDARFYRVVLLEETNP